MPVFALYNFNDAGTTAVDSALGNGAQDGVYINGATAAGGQGLLDGTNDLIKIYTDPAFQMDRGTLDIQFTLSQTPLTGTQTVLSRDSVGPTDGGYHIDILQDGSVVISHETPSGTTTFGTAPGFAKPGDEIKLSYSWDQGGTGGALAIDNLTTNAAFDQPVPNTLTMDMGGINQPWIIGAGQSLSDPGVLNDINQHFAGSVETFSLSDTVDNISGPDGIVRGTAGDNLIDTAYIDPFDTDRVDANDAILPGDAPNDDRILAGDGNDTVLSGLGDDSIEAGAGNDVVAAGDGDDTIFGGAGDDFIEGNAGNDSIVGGDGSSTLKGGDGRDTIIGGGQSLIYGDLVDGPDLPDQAYPGLYTADATPTNNTDLIYGGAGASQIYGGDDADTIYGGSAGDTIYGGVDDDVIASGAGNDAVLGGEGDDTVDGGAGDDTIYGDGAGNPSPELADDAGDLVADNNRDVLSGGAGNDVLFGGDDDDTLNGGAGADNLDGGLDDDLVNGDEGNDALVGGQGNDTLVGGADRDVITGGNAGDVVDGSETGDDYDTLDLRGLGPLTIAYDPANAENGVVTFRDAAGLATGTMSFTNIENVITSAVTPDAVNDVASTPEDTAVTIPVLANDTDPNGDPLTVTTATAPNGTVVINPDGTLSYTPNPNFNGPDVITYTITDPAGNTDTATVAVTVTPVPDAPEANPDTATTPAGNTVVIPVLANDTDPDGTPVSIFGTPTSANGTVTVNPDGTISFTPTPGFTGPATITYTITDPTGLTDTSTVTVNVTPVATAPDGIVRGTEGGDLIDRTYIDPFDTDRVDAGDAFLPGDAPNDDRILAGAGNDTVLAGLGDDSVEAGAGDDLVRGGQGDDTLFGQAGNDTIRGDSGHDSILGGAGNDSLDGGTGNDTLLSGDGNDVVRGGQGNDTISGGAGDDTLRGNAGNDSITGGDGNDNVRGGLGNDVIDTSGGGTTPLPDRGYPGLYPADTNPANDLDTVYGGQGDDTITTGDDADLIYGGLGNDSINGGFDDDTISGNQGDDTLIGGEGSDDIYAGQGNDLVYGGLGPSFPDSINIPDANGDLVPGNGRDEIFGGLGNDTIFGLDDDDTIDGGQGNDLIDGGVDDDIIRGSAGNDTITGGQGTDTLSGGNDRDTFIIGNRTDGLGDVIDGNEGGNDFDTLDLRGSGPFTIVYAADNPENGVVTYRDADGNPTGTLTFTNIENVIPCFTPGTMIATPKGEVAAEHLKAGDRIITRDNGIQEIRWVGQKALGWRDLHVNPHLKPVLLRQGSLGNGLPDRDMLVSPNHRLLVANDRTALYFDEHEVLVAAKHLVTSAGIAAVDSVGTTYIHFMFDRHEVVLSNGAWTESFQPGDYTLKGMGNAQRSEIFELFPDLKTEAGLEDYQAARRTLKRHEAMLLVK